MTGDGCQTPADRLLACAVGIAVGALAWFTGNWLEIPPELWEGISVSAGLRPPLHEFPLMWQRLVSFLVAEFGIDASIAVLKILGPVSLGLLAVMTYRLFSGCLPEVMRCEVNRMPAGRWTVRMVLVQGALLVTCSEPVWLAGRVFSPEMMKLVLIAGAFLSALLAVEKARMAIMIFTGALSGALAAETPLAVLPAVLCISALKRRYANPSAVLPPMANPLVFAITVRRTVSAFVFCWFGAMAVNLAFYRAAGGGGETDVGIFIAGMKYLLNYLTLARSAMSPTGFLLVVAVAILPLVILSARMRELSDKERFLPLPYAFFTAVAGVLAVLQSTGMRGFRFWDWEPGAVSSRFVLCMCILATSLAAVKVLGILAVEIFFRNHGRLLRDAFPDAVDDEPLAVSVLRSIGRSTVWMRFPARFEPLVVLALVLPFRFDPSVREMCSIVNDIVGQTAAECGDAGMVFTDGSFDAAVEVASAMHGRRLKAVSMMSGSGSYETALRLRGESDEESRLLLENGAADAMRVWVQSGNPRATNIAVQVGLELWRQSRLPVPALGGLVARTAGFADGEAERWAGDARDLAGRMIGFCEKNDLEKSGYPELRKFFVFGQWRLSRMCRMRANAADIARDVKLSEREHALADKLDACNPGWREVRDKMLSLHSKGGMNLSPREGLDIALKRADFRMARPFAERVLAVDADDMSANFAVAMGYFIEKRYASAEKHLEKCLLRKPKEPAVLNNLAVVQLRLGKLDQAETNALKALELLSDSSEIKATLRHIRAAKTK